jgi:hypothetical protein
MTVYSVLVRGGEVRWMRVGEYYFLCSYLQKSHSGPKFVGISVGTATLGCSEKIIDDMYLG